MKLCPKCNKQNTDVTLLCRSCSYQFPVIALSAKPSADLPQDINKVITTTDTIDDNSLRIFGAVLFAILASCTIFGILYAFTNKEPENYASKIKIMNVHLVPTGKMGSELNFQIKNESGKSIEYIAGTINILNKNGTELKLGYSFDQYFYLGWTGSVKEPPMLNNAVENETHFPNFADMDSGVGAQVKITITKAYVNNPTNQNGE